MAANELNYRSEGDTINYTPAAALSAGEPISLPDGRAGVPANDIAAGDLGGVRVKGIFEGTKTSGQVFLDGQELWWDHSANALVYTPANDDDFYVGMAYGDAASTATTAKVVLNAKPNYIVDLKGGPGNVGAFDHVPVLTAGTPSLAMVGSTARAAFSATAEAQKLDLLSKRSFPTDSNWILEAIVEVSTNADADVADLNIGVANGTHASDADSITESVFFHFDMGADLNLDAESDDGTTEVAATDTTVDWAVGTPVHLMIDGRDETDIQMYVNGSLVLSGSTFTLAAATGPLKALFHLEKSSNDSPGVVELDKLTVRISPP